MKTPRQVTRHVRARKKMSVEGRFDRRAAEMFGLELVMLAKAYGLKIAQVEVTDFERSAKA